MPNIYNVRLIKRIELLVSRIIKLKLGQHGLMVQIPVILTTQFQFKVTT